MNELGLNHVRRVKILAISPLVLLNWFRDGTPEANIIENQLPVDVHLIDVRYDAFRGVVEFLLQSDDWAELYEGCIPQTLDSPIYERKDTVRETAAECARIALNDEGLAIANAICKRFDVEPAK